MIKAAQRMHEAVDKAHALVPRMGERGGGSEGKDSGGNA